MIIATSSLLTADLQNKWIFVRADLNVPVQHTTILDDYRLQAILPTLTLILARGGKIILATHLGRPKEPVPELSTQQLIPWFSLHGLPVAFAPTIAQAKQLKNTTTAHIILLENLRFFPGEKKNDPVFAEQLASLAHFYVNDAFGTIHRADCSVNALPLLFSPSHRTIGLLIEKELHELNKLLNSPKKPYVLILGGGKVADKIPLLEQMITYIDTLILGPAVVFSFLHAQGKSVGKSLVDHAAQDACQTILDMAHQRGVRVIFPIDYLVADSSFEGPLSYTDTLSATDVGISIGPRTVELFRREIMNAQTIFYNGLMGDVRRKETLTGFKELCVAFAESNAFCVIGGGDSVAAIRQLGQEAAVDYLSTGGGATLAYLSGTSVPGISWLLGNGAEVK